MLYSQEQPLESSLCDLVRLAVCLFTCTSHAGPRACSTNTLCTPRPRAFARASSPPLTVAYSSPACYWPRGSSCFRRGHIYLIHRWDLVPFVLRGVIHVHLSRVVPVRGGEIGGSEQEGNTPRCKGMERRILQVHCLWCHPTAQWPVGPHPRF